MFSRQPINDFDGLLTNLDRQSALYDQLLALSDREREAIGRGDLKTLAELVAEKERVVSAAQTIEREREAACAQWAREWGMAAPPTLSDVRQRARDADSARRLDAAAIALSERVTRLRKSNTRNAHLIAQARRMNERLFAAALRHAHHPIYDQHGDTAADARSSIILDYRV